MVRRRPPIPARRRAGRPDTQRLARWPGLIQYVARDPRTEAPTPSSHNRPELPIDDHPPHLHGGAFDRQSPYHQAAVVPTDLVSRTLRSPRSWTRAIGPSLMRVHEARSRAARSTPIEGIAAQAGARVLARH